METPARSKKINFWREPLLGMAFCLIALPISGHLVSQAVFERGLYGNRFWMIGTECGGYTPGPMYFVASVVVAMIASTILMGIVSLFIRDLGLFD